MNIKIGKLIIVSEEINSGRSVLFGINESNELITYRCITEFNFSEINTSHVLSNKNEAQLNVFSIYLSHALRPIFIICEKKQSDSAITIYKILDQIYIFIFICLCVFFLH